MMNLFIWVNEDKPFNCYKNVCLKGLNLSLTLGTLACYSHAIVYFYMPIKAETEKMLHTVLGAMRFEENNKFC